MIKHLPLQPSQQVAYPKRADTVDESYYIPSTQMPQASTMVSRGPAMSRMKPVGSATKLNTTLDAVNIMFSLRYCASQGVGSPEAQASAYTPKMGSDPSALPAQPIKRAPCTSRVPSKTMTF